ncbi:BRCA1-associated RING domain protein 1 isoform X3 [Alnus glutinosa]|uniref:BRCA1-associated RING domain protein 1 isoform X3 n=1 Tax=Alnus glutinosa TaxID=3517 RepID=UPI002D76B0A2|nr:BRCA1-associated RING domain protein 1 isoform X3 [Alnus glutinosa]
MGDSVSGSGRFLNPWVLHFQKMGLELKCPLCLCLLERPMLLPCNHIFCNSCIPISTQLKSECPVCKAQYLNQDSRPAPYMENLATIYRGLESTFSANLFQHVSSGSRRILEQCQTSLSADKLSKEPFEIIQGDKSCSGQSIFSLSANKRVQVPLNLNHSAEDGVSKNDGYEKHSMPADGKGGRGGEKLNQVVSTNSPSLSLPMGPGGLEEPNVVEIEMNRVSQSLLNTPPSIGDAKGSDGDSYDQSLGKSLIKRAIDKDSEGKIRQLGHDGSASETEDGHLRGIKRQKKLNYGASELSMKADGCIPPVVSHSEIVVTPSSDFEAESRVPSAAAQQPVISDASFVPKSICAFCQSPEISVHTGPMLHYANGKIVVGDEATLSNVIHVHRLCVDWAPQVYFVNETIKNLKAEVARGAKLKCSRCGQKGAALGCYAKSCRRSYHLPCAAQISNCRWDHENFLMLCPAHSSVKFPNERGPQQSELWVAPKRAKKWVICGSALSSKEKVLVLKFASMCGATVAKYWKPNVTHVIASTDAQGACTRTLKVLMAILNGRWIVNIGWVKACMEAMHPVDEVPYEVCLDNHGCSDGPKTGRLMASNNAPKLFNGFKFYFSGDFVPEYKDDLQNLVVTAGGAVLKSKEELLSQSCDEVAPVRVLIVYNLDSPQGCKVGEEVDILWKRLSEAQDVAADIGSHVIGHTWLVESIAACKLQPFVS